MEKYKMVKLIGEGTYGVVSLGIEITTGREVAIKKIRKILVNKGVDDGVSFSAIREIKMLQELKHVNVVELLDVFAHKSNVYLVFELMAWDLQQVIEDRSIILKPSDIKSYMKMLLQGIEACHNNWILHRDLKPNNLLCSHDGDMKLADFGLARQYGSPHKVYSPQAVTIFYRAPELLFGAKSYGPSVDMWSIGCIFAELMLRTPYLPGTSEIDQLTKIFSALGTPNETVWPGVTSLPNYIQFTDFPATPFAQLFSAASPDAIDLLQKMLTYNPAARCSATEALNHPYFANAPKPTPSKDLPRPAKPSTTIDMNPNLNVSANPTVNANTNANLNQLFSAQSTK